MKILEIIQETSIFHGRPCTRDCSGHQAGYKWAEKNQVVDPAGCQAKSGSFSSGCEIAVNQKRQQRRKQQKQPALAKQVSLGQTPQA